MLKRCRQTTPALRQTAFGAIAAYRIVESVLFAWTGFISFLNNVPIISQDSSKNQRALKFPPGPEALTERDETLRWC